VNICNFIDSIEERIQEDPDSILDEIVALKLRLKVMRMLGAAELWGL
jgi:hypothetical protein